MTEQDSSNPEQYRHLLGSNHAGADASSASVPDQARQQAVHLGTEHVYGPKEVDYGMEELVVLCLVRDGRPYVRSFIDHYSSMGVKHLVFLDNGSTDSTVEALCNHDNVTVLRSRLPFREYQLDMKRYLIHRFGVNRWSLYVDIDELFDYPYSDTLDLASLLRYLNNGKYTAVVAQMLDMFADRPLTNIARDEDEPLKELHRFYDISNVRVQNYHPAGGDNNVLSNDEVDWLRNGIKTVLFGHHPMLSKHPLVFLDGKLRPMDTSSHRISNAHVADFTCVLFHYKLLDRLYEQALRAVSEKNYPNREGKYEKYVSMLEKNPKLHIKQDTAREIKSVNDLVENQFLVVGQDYLTWVDLEEEKKAVAAAEGEPRRFAEAYFRVRAEAQTLKARRLERQVAELKSSLSKERHRVQSLEEINQNLEIQVQSIRTSRTWRMLGVLGRIRARVARSE